VTETKPTRVFSGAPWEKAISYCRAIRSGPFVAVSGTTSMLDGAVYGTGDPYKQTQRCLEIIESALKELGLDRSNIIRTRMFVTDISKWEQFGEAHGEFFKDHPPASSMYEVKALISHDLLIEIEADAIAHD
jgi:enamine deaminase RidA (YjgF/YER057c/UK114 family)